jgi:hypothetical protein
LENMVVKRIWAEERRAECCWLWHTTDLLYTLWLLAEDAVTWCFGKNCHLEWAPIAVMNCPEEYELCAE